MALTFEEILELAQPEGPVKYFCKSWKREVFLRDPTTREIEDLRTYERKTGDGSMLWARIVQMFLCDEEGNRIVPDGQKGLTQLAGLKGNGIREIAEHISGMMLPPNDPEIDAIQKN